MTSHQSSTWCPLSDCAEYLRSATILGCVAAIGASLLLSDCGKSTKPGPVRYDIYVGSTETDQMYILDPDSLSVRDSIPRLGKSLDLLLSPDGQWLYVSRSSSVDTHPLLKINLQTRKQSAVLPGYGSDKLQLVNNGEMILWGNYYFYGGSVDAATLSLVHDSNDPLRWRGGPEAGTRIAVGYFPGGREGPSQIRALDLSTGEFTGSYIPRLKSDESVGAYQIMLLPDCRRVVVAGPAQSGCWVLVGDVISGETLLQFRRPACQGEIAISPDGSFAVVSDPSAVGHPEAPEPGIDVIDLRSLTHLKRFTPIDFGIDCWDLFSQVQFTSDSRKVFVAPRPATPGRVRIIDLTILQVENVVWPDTGIAWIGAMGYGPQPR